jgi:NifU-like protein involved in Fe-S cluster formation
MNNNKGNDNNTVKPEDNENENGNKKEKVNNAFDQLNYIDNNSNGTGNGKDIPWIYSDLVKKHFFNPRKILKDNENFNYNGIGRVGSPACGDEMLFMIKVDPKTNIIKDCRWRTFGCASAISSTSMLSEMILKNKGMTIEEAKKITPRQIIDNLGGLPKQKIHCSVLGDQALRKAIEDYEKKIKD